MGFLFPFRATVAAAVCWAAFHAQADPADPADQATKSAPATQTASDLKFTTEVLGGLDIDKPLLIVRVSSRNGCHIALLCKGAHPNTNTVLVDGTSGPEFGGILNHTPVFSPDSSRVIYGARIDEKWIVIEAGKSKPETCAKWDRLLETSFSFSADSRHLAYVAKRDSKWYVVADGVEKGPYEEVTSLPVFSGDGSRLIYGIQQEGKQKIIDQDNPGQAYDLVGAAVVSENGKRIAFGAQKDGRQFVVTDGQPSELYGGIYGESIQFSPDGVHAVYAAERGIQRFVVLDGKPGPDFENVSGNSVRFSPDGQRLGYIVHNGDQWKAVVDGEAGPAFSKIERLVFSADSSHFAYAAGDEASRFVVLDGEKGPAYTEIVKDSLVFSPTGASVAYCGTQENKKIAVIFNGKKMGEYDLAGNISFSPDGKHITYRAAVGEGFAVYIDDRQVFGPAMLVCEPAFRSDGTLEFILMDQKSLCRVTAKPFEKK